MTAPRSLAGRSGQMAFWSAVLLWMLVTVILWPLSLSFGDEVGYVGQAKLLLEGRVAPVITDVGVWHPTPDGLHPKYPLFLPLLLAPLFALSPALVFLPSMLAAIGLAYVAGRFLASWGRSPLWGLVMLIDPTIVMLARTAMADVLLACFGVCAWYFMRRRAFWPTLLFAVATMAVKTNGVVIVGSLLAGEACALWLAGKRTLAGLTRALLAPISGMIVGGSIVVALNLVANGTIHSSYRESASQAFGLRFLPTSGYAHLKSLLLCPPLLLAGVVPLWRRRELAAVFAVATSTVMMSVFFYVDWGLGRIDTLVLSRRLILPVVAFLLVGYADLVAGLVDRLPWARLGQAALVVLPAVLALALGMKHRQWQEPPGLALARARQWVERSGNRELGLTPSARKVGLLFPGRTAEVIRGVPGPAVVLCGTADASYRLGNMRQSCELADYRVVESLKAQGYEILMRSPAP